MCKLEKFHVISHGRCDYDINRRRKTTKNTRKEEKTVGTFFCCTAAIVVCSWYHHHRLSTETEWSRASESELMSFKLSQQQVYILQQGNFNTFLISFFFFSEFLYLAVVVLYCPPSSSASQPSPIIKNIFIFFAWILLIISFYRRGCSTAFDAVGCSVDDSFNFHLLYFSCSFLFTVSISFMSLQLRFFLFSLHPLHSYASLKNKERQKTTQCRRGRQDDFVLSRKRRKEKKY